MRTLHFSILIDTDRKKVWNAMLEDKTYREWTRAFYEGSYYEGSWKKGSEIRFLAKNDKGKLEGMFSRIKDNIEYQFISIEHLGIVSDGKVDTTSDEVKKWASSFENYTFTDKGGKTEVLIDIQVDEDYIKMFEDMWPKALKRLKEICEK